MDMKGRRIQITLDEEQYQRLDGWVRRHGITIPEGIRRMLSQLPPNSDERRAAIAAILAADPMPVPADPTELRRELDAARESAPR
jgi:hypothetical protein